MDMCFPTPHVPTQKAGSPFWVLGAAICDWLDVLLATSREDAIYAVCNTLKISSTAWCLVCTEQGRYDVTLCHRWRGWCDLMS